MTSSEEGESSSSGIHIPPDTSASSSIHPVIADQESTVTAHDKAFAEAPIASVQSGQDEPLTSSLNPSPSARFKPTKRTNVEDLRAGLSALGLDIKGKKESLYKRLLKAFFATDDARSERERSPTPAPEEDVPATYEARLRATQETWKSFLCFDVEATCRGGREYDWPNEIIEFPVVLIQWLEDPSAPSGRRLQHVDTFHSYVRPTWQPKLTEFCVSLTGITQDTVDQSPKFPEMLGLLEQWLDKHELRDEDGRLKNALWVTDGPWDLRDFVPKQLFISPTNPPYPPYLFGQYLNIKQAVQTVMSELWQDEQALKAETPSPPSGGATARVSDDTADSTRSSTSAAPPAGPPSKPLVSPVRIISTHKTMSKTNRETKYKGPGFYFPIPGQLEVLGLGPFEGRQHSGIDDATNVSRILIALSEKPKVVIEPNARTPHPKHSKRYQWMGSKRGEVIFEEWMSNPKAVLLKGEKGGQSDVQPTGKKSEDAEWVLKQDASGRFVCVKEAKGPNGLMATGVNGAGKPAEEAPDVEAERKDAVAVTASETDGAQPTSHLTNHVDGTEPATQSEEFTKDSGTDMSTEAHASETSMRSTVSTSSKRTQPANHAGRNSSTPPSSASDEDEAAVSGSLTGKIASTVAFGEKDSSRGVMDTPEYATDCH